MKKQKNMRKELEYLIDFASAINTICDRHDILLNQFRWQLRKSGINIPTQYQYHGLLTKKMFDK